MGFADEVSTLVNKVSAEEFAADRIRLRAGERCIFLIGEAARQLPESIRERHPEGRWREIIGMRNVLAHAYFRVDPSVVYSALRDDVPELRRLVERIRAQGGFPDPE